MLWIESCKVYMYVKDVKINDAESLLTGRATTSRKKTDFDKLDYKGYVTSNWNIKIIGKEAVKEAKKLKKGDSIIVTKFNLTNGEMYEEGKFSHPSLQILAWKYKDGKESNEQEPEDEEDDVPF
jgi:hypothetical protein